MENILKKNLKFFFKNIDSFGQPILLSYKGRTEYKTWFGGLLTVILIGTLVAFSFEASLALLKR